MVSWCVDACQAETVAANAPAWAGTGGLSATLGLPPSLDPGLIIDSTLRSASAGQRGGGEFDALGQLFFDKRPAESAGAAQFGEFGGGAFKPTPQMQEAVRGLRSCRVFVGGLSNIDIDPETDFLFVSFKFPPGIFSPSA